MKNSIFFTEDELNNLEKIQFKDFELSNENLSLILDNFIKNIKTEDCSYYTKIGKEIIDIILKFRNNPLHISIVYKMISEKCKENIICKVIVLYFYGNIYKHSDAIYSYEKLIEKYFIETNYCKKRNISYDEYKEYLYNELPKLLSFYNYSLYTKDLFKNHTIASSFDALCMVNDNKKFINGSGRTLSTELRMIIFRDVLNIVLKNRKRKVMKNVNMDMDKNKKVKKGNLNFLTSYEMYKDLLSEDLLSTDYMETYKNLEIVYEICN